MKTYAELVNGDVIPDEKHIELTYLNSHPARTGGKLVVYMFKRIGGDVIMRWQFPTDEIAPTIPGNDAGVRR
jgi:hypothetical protein